jgi:hypothetical protein
MAYEDGYVSGGVNCPCCAPFYEYEASYYLLEEDRDVFYESDGDVFLPAPSVEARVPAAKGTTVSERLHQDDVYSIYNVYYEKKDAVLHKSRGKVLKKIPTKRQVARRRAAKAKH